jgi:hypothetical protein
VVEAASWKIVPGVGGRGGPRGSGTDGGRWLGRSRRKRVARPPRSCRASSSRRTRARRTPPDVRRKAEEVSPGSGLLCREGAHAQVPLRELISTIRALAAKQTSFQEAPVASIAPCVTPRPCGGSRSASRPAVIVGEALDEVGPPASPAGQAHTGGHARLCTSSGNGDRAGARKLPDGQTVATGSKASVAIFIHPRAPRSLDR